MPAKTMAAFGGRLRALRERSTLSQVELAAKIGSTAVNICRLEAGRQKPTWDTVQRLAAALGVMTDHFRE